jgi:hypothetical protein
MPGNKICRKHADADNGIVRFLRQVCFIPLSPSVVVYGWLLGLQLTIMVGSWERLATSKRWVDGVAQQQISLSQLHALSSLPTSICSPICSWFWKVIPCTHVSPANKSRDWLQRTDLQQTCLDASPLHPPSILSHTSQYWSWPRRLQKPRWLYKQPIFSFP